MRQARVSLIPRWRTYAGQNEFTTVAMDVTGFSRATLHLERRELVGNLASFVMYLQESSDRESWSDLIAGGVDPYEGETRVVMLSRRWFRLKISLTGTDVRASCYAEGLLV